MSGKGGRSDSSGDEEGAGKLHDRGAGVDMDEIEGFILGMVGKGRQEVGGAMEVDDG